MERAEQEQLARGWWTALSPDVVQLEGFARKLAIAVAAGIVDRETLDAAGELLDAHIRLEERRLFPLIEELVPDDELRRLGLADRDATCVVRRPLTS